MYDIIIIGGGPAGLTAATYARRAGKTVLCIEKSGFGGQITWSPKVENFPSVESISGMELGDLMMAQAERQGAEFELDEVLEIIDCGAVKQVKTDFGGVFEAKAVIVATGAKPKMAGIPESVTERAKQILYEHEHQENIHTANTLDDAERDNIVKISQNYNDIKDYLNALDVNYLSPIEAFSKLSELKQKVK